MGIVIDSNGVINVAASTPGTYRITYTTAGTCPSSSTQDVTINALDNAAFSYSASSYTTADADPTPTITGLTGGTFSGSTGLVINSTTGEIDLSASTVASHTVTYNTTSSGSSVCPNTSTQSVEIAVAGIANNYSMSFDGNNKIIVSNSSTLNFSGNISFSMWLKYTNTTSYLLFCLFKDAAIGKQYSIDLRPHGSGQRKIQLETTANGVTTARSTQTLAIPQNIWTHLSITIDSGVVNGTKFYVNGTPETSPFAHTIESNETNLIIGGNNTSNFEFIGLIDELAIWNTALTSTQVSEIYNATSTNLTKDLTTVSGSNLKYWNRMGD